VSDLFLGRGYRLGDGPERSQDVSIPSELRRRSSYTCGQAGSGKTSLFKTETHQDVQAEQGFALIDVEDTLGPDVLAYLAEALAEPRRVVVVDPTRTEAAVPLNPLYVPPGVHPHTRVEDVLASCRRAWWDSWGARLEDILRHSLTLFVELKLTLAELPRFISDGEFRKRCVAASADPDTRLFFEGHLGGIRPSEYRTWVESTRNKIDAFVGNPFIRPMIAAETCLDFRALMDRGDWFILLLPDRVLRDSGKLLGMLCVSMIFSAALQRPEGSSLWPVYADEYQTVASRGFVDLITRARKRGIGVSVAHQSLSQPPFDRDPAFVDTMLSNCAVQCYFQMGRKDAERLAPEVFPITGTQVKRRKKHPIWGDFGDPTFYSVQEEKEHAIGQLEHQKPREFFVKIKGDQGTEVWVCETYDVPECSATEDDVEQLVIGSLANHGVSLEAIQKAQIARLARFESRKPIKTTDEYEGEPA
jgi:hypothetical protein